MARAQRVQDVERMTRRVGILDIALGLGGLCLNVITFLLLFPYLRTYAWALLWMGILTNSIILFKGIYYLRGLAQRRPWSALALDWLFLAKPETLARRLSRKRNPIFYMFIAALLGIFMFSLILLLIGRL